MHLPRLACLVLSSAALAACQDGPRLTEPAPDAPEAAAFSSSGGHAHQATANRFRMSLEVNGTPKPGQPLRISATARAILSTDEAELQLAMPEVVQARSSGWDPRVYRGAPTGAPVPALERTRGAMPKGATRSLEHQVSIPAPGYYRVVVSAAPTSPQPLSIHGTMVQNEAHREAWLWIAEEGGRITQSFDATLFGDTLLAQPGPFRRIRAAAAERSSSASAGASAPRLSVSAASTTDLTRPQVRYYHQDLGRYDPVPDAQVNIRYRYIDHSGVIVDYTTTQYTGTDGRLQIDCGVLDDSYNSDVTYTVTAFTANTRVQVGAGSGAQSSYQEKLQATCSGTGYLWDPPVEYVELENKHARVFVNTSETIRASDNTFGVSRGWVKVLLRTDGGGSKYDGVEDIVYIADNRVWGEGGIRSQAHEYGHAFHSRALNGQNAERVGECPDPHYLNGPHNLGCGFREGIAHYYAAMTRGSLADDMEAGVWYPNGKQYYDSDSFAKDGSAMEGAIASFLWDVTDAANEDYDAVHFPTGYLMDLIRTCYVDGKLPSGIDYLVYCMEQTVDPEIANHEYYFDTRSPKPTSQQNSAGTPAGWSRDAVRNLWIYNLHRFPPDTDGGYALPPSDCDQTSEFVQPCS